MRNLPTIKTINGERMASYTIDKPLSGTFVRISEKNIDFAIKANKDKFEIVIANMGAGIVNPVKWKTEGQRVTQVFKMPLNPMVLYGGYVPIPEYKFVPRKSVEVKKENSDKIQTTIFDAINKQDGIDPIIKKSVESLVCIGCGFKKNICKKSCSWYNREYI